MKPIVLMAAVPALALALTAPAAGQEADPASGSAPETAPAADFNGNWVLNTDLSQDLVTTMRQAVGGGGRSEGMRGSGGMGGGMIGGRGGRSGSMGGGMSGGRGGGGQRSDREAPDMAKMQERTRRMQKEYSRLEIFHDGSELNLTNGLDISQLHFTDGRKSKIWTDRGEMSARANWENGSLRIRTSAAGSRDGKAQGPERVRIFTLSEDGSQLILIEERSLPNQKDPVRIRMVYDRAG